jgi:hypothetical protein
MWAIVASILLGEMVLGGSLDIRNEPVEHSPGLYCQHETQARLYNSEWKIVTYLDLQQASDNVDAAGKYIEATVDFCNKHSNSLWLNLTECRTTIRDATRKLERLKGMRNLASQLTKTERNLPRTKRGLFNFVGQISHSLFGTLDSDDEQFFNNNISQLEEEQAGLVRLAREQMVVVKSTLKSVNRTLNEVTNNELILEKGLQDIKEFINKENGEIKRQYTYTSMLVILNDHAIQIQRALEEVKDECNIIIQSCLNVKKGIIQPQVLSPIHMIDILRSSQDLFPRGLQVPVQLTEAYAYLILNIITIDSYIVGSNLVYIVKVPLSTHFVYDIYRVIPFPMRINNTRFKYTFIQPEREYVLMDSTRQFYAKFKHENIRECREMSKEQIICKQNFPLLMSHSTND